MLTWMLIALKVLTDLVQRRRPHANKTCRSSARSGKARIGMSKVKTQTETNGLVAGHAQDGRREGHRGRGAHISSGAHKTRSPGGSPRRAPTSDFLPHAFIKDTHTFIKKILYEISLPRGNDTYDGSHTETPTHTFATPSGR